MQCRFNDTLAYKGECRRQLACPATREYFPVCGVDKKTYSNKSELSCAKIALDYEGKCNNNQSGNGTGLEPPCPSRCNLTYNPVCGRDNVTYRNKC